MRLYTLLFILLPALVQTEAKPTYPDPAAVVAAATPTCVYSIFQNNTRSLPAVQTAYAALMPNPRLTKSAIEKRFSGLTFACELASSQSIEQIPAGSWFGGATYTSPLCTPDRFALSVAHSMRYTGEDSPPVLSDEDDVVCSQFVEGSSDFLTRAKAFFDNLKSNG